jgi:glycosyltransferase involved in cell wall biosynthesis
VPRMLERRGKLSALYTDIWAPWAGSVPLPGLLVRLRSRYSPGLGRARVHARNVKSMLRGFALRREKYTDAIAQGQSFAEWVVSRLKRSSLPPESVCFGYTCASLELLRFARQRGAGAVHGQIDPGPAWYRLRREESLRWPGAESDVEMPASEFLDRVTAEWDAADRILVNSAHSRECLVSEGVPAEKIRVVPLCYEPLVGQSATEPRQESVSSFTVLYVGTVNLAKGFPYFGEAASLLGRGIRFKAAGSIELAPEFLRSNRHWPVELLGHLARGALAKEISQAKVLVFPSLSDGFGMVQLEAQSRGVPVIATPNCGDVVIDGESGYIVPPRCSQSIAARVQGLIDDRELYTAMSKNSLSNSRRFTLEAISEIFVATFADYV